MYFTREDYKKILKWLLSNAIKDTEFDLAVTPLQGEETVVFVLNGQNVRVYLKDLANLLMLLGIPDLVNVSSKYNAYQISLAQAISYIPYLTRLMGLIITFNDTDNNWRVFQFRGERVNQWNNTTLWIDIISGGNDKAVIPDLEDLTWTENGPNMVLKFKDRTYNPNDFSGLGMKILRKNVVQNINVLTQLAISAENTAYIIRYDFNLMGQTINIPAGSVLHFDGGSFKNGTIVGNNTEIINGLLSIFDSSISVSGSWKNTNIKPEWFGAKGDGASDDSPAINSAVSFAKQSGINCVKLLNRQYYIASPITIYSNIIFGSDYTRELNNYSIPKLIVKSDINGIEFVRDDLATEVNNILIIGVSLYKTGGKVGNGINYLADVNEASGLRYCLFQGVSIEGFEKGIYLEANGNAPIAYSKFESCLIVLNTIGIHLKGTLSLTWANANYFSNCNISLNSIGGIFLEGLSGTSSFPIYSSDIEGNGLNYSDAEYTKYGCAFGFKMAGTYRGNITFHDCYIEANYPRRQEGNNIIYPSDISTKCATFIIEGGNVACRQSYINDIGVLGLISGPHLVSFIDNKWGKENANIMKNALFLIDVSDPYVGNYSQFIFNEQILLSDSLTSTTLYLFLNLELASSNFSYYNIDVNCNKFGKFQHTASRQTYASDVYIDTVLGNSKAFGLTKNDPLPSLDSLIYKLNGSGNGNDTFYPTGDILIIHILNSATHSISSGFTLDVNRVMIRSEAKTNKLTLSTPIYYKGTRLSFENMTLELANGCTNALEFVGSNATCVISFCNIAFNNNSLTVFGNTVGYPLCCAFIQNNTKVTSLVTGGTNNVVTLFQNVIMGDYSVLRDDSTYYLINNSTNEDGTSFVHVVIV